MYYSMRVKESFLGVLCQITITVVKRETYLNYDSHKML